MTSWISFLFPLCIGIEQHFIFVRFGFGFHFSVSVRGHNEYSFLPVPTSWVQIMFEMMDQHQILQSGRYLQNNS